MRRSKNKIPGSSLRSILLKIIFQLYLNYDSTWVVPHKYSVYLQISCLKNPVGTLLPDAYKNPVEEFIVAVEAVWKKIYSYALLYNNYFMQHYHIKNYTFIRVAAFVSFFDRLLSFLNDCSEKNLKLNDPCD